MVLSHNMAERSEQISSSRHDRPIRTTRTRRITSTQTQHEAADPTGDSSLEGTPVMARKTKSVIATLAVTMVAALGTMSTSVAVDSKAPATTLKKDTGGWCC